MHLIEKTPRPRHPHWIVTDDTGASLGTVALTRLGRQGREFYDARAADGCDLGAHPRREDAVAEVVADAAAGRDRTLFGPAALQSEEQVGLLGGSVSRFGKSFIGEPDALTREIERDLAVQEADTQLPTIPNTRGVTENLRILSNIGEHIAPSLRSAHTD